MKPKKELDPSPPASGEALLGGAEFFDRLGRAHAIQGYDRPARHEDG
jgi:hypothetical protein